MITLQQYLVLKAATRTSNPEQIRSYMPLDMSEPSFYQIIKRCEDSGLMQRVRIHGVKQYVLTQLGLDTFYETKEIVES